MRIPEDGAPLTILDSIATFYLIFMQFQNEIKNLSNFVE